MSKTLATILALLISNLGSIICIVCSCILILNDKPFWWVFLILGVLFHVTIDSK